MIGQALLKNLTREYVETFIERRGVKELFEIEETPDGLLVKIPAALRALQVKAEEEAASAPTPADQPAAAPARKVISTAITDGALADAERAIGKAVRAGSHHLLVVEAPAHYDEADITAERIAADPAISIITRVQPAADVVPAEAEAAPAPEPAPSPSLSEQAAPKSPTKIITTHGVTDDQGRTFVIEVPEDFEHSDLITREIVETHPDVSIVSRAKLPPPEPEQIAEMEADEPEGDGVDVDLDETPLDDGTGDPESQPEQPEAKS